MNTFRRQFFSLLGVLGLFLYPTSQAFAEAERSITLPDGMEVSYQYFPAKVNQTSKLFIWIPSEVGINQDEQDLIRQVAASGIEIWYTDFLAANFFSTTASDVDRIPAEQVAGVINAAVNTGKQVYLLSSNRGAIPALRGVRTWQQQYSKSNAFRGLILLSPKLYVETPNPGQAAQLMPIVLASNVALFIFQPQQSPWFWKLEQMLPALEKGGSEVFIRTLPGLRDRFHFRPDATTYEQAFVKQLPDLFQQAVTALDYLSPVRSAVNRVSKQPLASTTNKRERVLSPYPGSPLAPTLRLKSLTEGVVDLADYRGKVVLVNFWASWCPPCVHEMPSMQRLYDSMTGRPFAMLAVNMAEDISTVTDFVTNKIAVEFTILLDEDGRALKRWQVFAFPTTFIIDKQGRIRYALFGSRQWDTADVQNIIERLMVENI